MIRSILIATLALSSASALACGDHAKQASTHDVLRSVAAHSEKVSTEKLATSKFKVEGMMCTGCQNSIRSKVSEIQGVRSVLFTKAKAKGKKTQELIEVAYLPGSVTDQQIVAAVAATGDHYKAVPLKN